MAASKPAPIGSGIGAMSSEALILIAGILTSLATVAVNAIAARSLNFDFLSLSFWLVIPAGAIIGGMAAASGYYFAALLTHTMPSKKFLLEMVGIAVSTWILALWVDYATAQFSDGTFVQSQVSFWDFFKFQAEHMQLSISARAGTTGVETGELGGWGYAREITQLLGFMVGGFAVWAFLSDREICETCRKYAKTDSLLDAQPPERLQNVLDVAELSFPDIVEDSERVLGDSRLVGMDLKVHRCPKCFAEWARPAVAIQSGGDVVSKKLARYNLTAEQAAALRSACAAAAS